MQRLGYYEIIDYAVYQTGLKASAIAGNIRFNRMHWHDSLEIICCIYGCCTINVQGNIYHLSEGDLVTIERGQCHEISAGTSQGLQLVFSVDSSVLYGKEPSMQYFLNTVGEAWLPCHHPDIQIARSGIAKMAYMLLPDDALVRQWLSGKYLVSDPHLNFFQTEEIWYRFHKELYQVLECLARHKKSFEETDANLSFSKPFHHCIEIIHKEYQTPLSAKKIADEIGFSEPTVYRLFQKYMGISFINYLNSVRVSAACGLLEKSDYDIAEISDRCGFSSISNFYRVFHQFTLTSPKKYRNHRGSKHTKGLDMQSGIMLLNQFDPFWELPYTKDLLWEI